MNFSNIFAYLELATGAVSVIGTIQHLVAGSAPLTGAELVATVQPIIQGIQPIVPKITIPMDLVTDIANGAADAINNYYKKTTPAA
jgi:hypothetical protein